MSDIKFSRKWCYPSSETFSIKPIRELLERYVTGGHWLDPFARNSKVAHITNDLNPNTSADFHLDALEFLRMYQDSSVTGVLFDPPYSLRQVKECYDGIGKSLSQHETRYFYTDLKKEIARILKPGGTCISFGWNSGGIGKNLGFDIVEILLVPHGGPHYDTIVTVDVKR